MNSKFKIKLIQIDKGMFRLGDKEVAKSIVSRHYRSLKCQQKDIADRTGSTGIFK